MTRQKLWSLQARFAPYLFVAPFVVLFAIFMAYPLVRSIILSLYKVASPRNMKFIGLGNYRFLLHDRAFLYAVLNTTYFALVFIVLQIPLSLGLAVALNRRNVPARNFLRFAFFSSHLVGSVFVAIIFSVLLTPRHGLVNKAIGAALPFVGTETQWTSKPLLAMPAIIMAALWLSVGYGMIYFLAALQGVDRDLYEAAEVDGAGRWSRFWHVTLPGIQPVLRFLVLVGLIGAFQLFELPYVLFGQTTGPGGYATTIVMYLYVMGFDTGDLGYASAVGWVLVLIILSLSLAQVRASPLQRWGGATGMTTASAIMSTPKAPPREALSPKPSPARGVMLNFILIALAIISLTPFFWLICATFKNNDDFFQYTFLPWSQPERWTLANYRFLFARYPFAAWLLNSLFLACAQTVIVVMLSSLGGFALAKYRFRFKKPLMFVMLATMLIPYQVLLPSLQLMMYRIGWINSYAAVIVPGAVSVFGIFLFMQSMKLVPDDLLHAGRVDGCTELRLWWEVALPIVRPMIGAYALLSFMAHWNSFLWPQIVLQQSTKYTLPIGLANMMGLPEYQAPYGVLMAGTLLSIVPVVVLFFVLQRDFIAGLASGAVKG